MIRISRSGRQHDVDIIDNKVYYKCNHAVGGIPLRKFKKVFGTITCKNCRKCNEKWILK